MIVYIECGTHNGNTLRRFLKSGRHVDKVFSFECNPHFFDSWSDLEKMPNVQIIRKGVWTKEGTLDLFVGGPSFMGSTFLKKKSASIDYSKPVTVPTIDFSAWLKENVTKEDYVILRMNVEGAEYPILDKMIRDKTIELIDEAVIGFHRNRFSEDETAARDHAFLVAYLKRRLGDKFSDHEAPIKKAEGEEHEHEDEGH